MKDRTFIRKAQIVILVIILSLLLPSCGRNNPPEESERKDSPEESGIISEENALSPDGDVETLGIEFDFDSDIIHITDGGDTWDVNYSITRPNVRVHTDGAAAGYVRILREDIYGIYTIKNTTMGKESIFSGFSLAALYSHTEAAPLFNAYKGGEQYSPWGLEGLDRDKDWYQAAFLFDNPISVGEARYVNLLTAEGKSYFFSFILDGIGSYEPALGAGETRQSLFIDDNFIHRQFDIIEIAEDEVETLVGIYQNPMAITAGVHIIYDTTDALLENIDGDDRESYYIGGLHGDYIYGYISDEEGWPVFIVFDILYVN
jgi:hypothetical protein